MRSMGWIPVVGAVLLAGCGGGGGSDIQGPPANTPPTANFGATCAGLSCTFSDSSTDAGGSIKTWQWDFGDGATSQDQNPTHDFAAAQAYNVSLTVTDNGGATGTVTKSVTPQPPPTAELTCTNATAPGGATTCSFTLPVAAAVKVVWTDDTPCEAHGDVFRFTAPVVDTLSADACFTPVGTELDLPSSPAGTQVTFDYVGGLTAYMTAIQVSGQYPAWTLTGEDAVGAPFPVNFGDLGLTLTVEP